MDAAFRLSPQQRRLWKLQDAGRLSPYRVACAVELTGELETATLRAAAVAVAGRHEILRTVFRRLPDVKLPVQVVLPPGGDLLRETDLTGLDPAEQERRLGGLVDAMDWTPAEIAAEPPLRLTLAALAPARSVLVIGLPALCADAAALQILVREIAAAYASGGTVPNEPPVQYADLAEWLNTMLEREDTREERERWHRFDLAALHAARLPFERQAPEAAFAVGAVAVPMPEEGAWGERLAARAAERGTAAPVFLLAAWSALLSRFTGSSGITVGTLFEGRSYEGLEEAVGTLARVLPLEVRIEPGEPFAALLDQLDAAVRDAHERQEYFSWEEPGFLPFAFELDDELETHPAGAVTFSPLAAHRLACGDRFRLKLSGRADRLELQYDPAAFARADVERLAGQFATLLNAALDAPGSPVAHLEAVPAAEQGELRELDADAGPATRGCVHLLFAQQARRVPEEIAAVCRESSLTYAELDRRANGLAHTLLRLGVAPGARVACSMPRCLEVLIGLLGTLKAGAAWVPLDPQQPAERLALMLEDLGSPVLLTTADLAVSLPATAARILRLDADEEAVAESAEAPEVAVSDAGLAYVIFTSGSTGRPKGVAVEHRQLFNYVAGVTARLDLPAGARFATVSTFAADLGHTMIFPSLCTGGTLQVIEDEALTDPEALAEAFARRPADCLKIVPSHLASLLAAASRPERLLPRLRLVLGGEACSPELIATLRRLAPPSCRIFNHYGPTETTVGVLTHEVPAGGDLSGPLPLGRPLPGTRVYVTDSLNRLVPFWMTGELWIGGAGVARGYLGRPDATAERFLPDSWDGSPGARLYRTGDLARRRPDGTVEFLGRGDDQVKLRGFRIEPGEIAAQLHAHPAVGQAAVVLRDGEGGGEPRLVAYWVPARGADAEPGELRSFLAARLPAVMVPSSFVRLGELPLTPNGKLDRKALPAPDWQALEEGWLAPRTPVEEVLAGLWAELLGRERVGATDSFFDLGGHSLLATQVMSRLRRAFGVEMQLRDLFEAPVLAQLAARIDAALRAGTGLLSPPLVPVPRNGPLPLSFAQQRLWFIDQLDPGSPLYNIPVALRLEGPLRYEVLNLCLGEIVRRHEVLRTVYAAAEGSPVQVIQPAELLRLPVVDLSGLPAPRREAQALVLTGEEARRPFDLASGPLLRGVLLRLAGEDHVTALTLHHIVSDGWSMGILVREVTALFAAFAENEPSPLPELPVQYADFAVWQRSWLQDEVLEGEISFWRRQLAGLPPLLELPTDRPRPAVQSFRGASWPARLPAGLTRQIEALSRREGATVFMVLLAAFQALLARYSGQQELAVGSPVAGRNREEIEGLIGFFVNTLVLRGDLTGEPSFRELLSRVRETALAAHTHQDVPFEKIVQELMPDRSLAQTPLFQVMLILQNAPVASLEIQSLRLRPLTTAGTTSKFDLTFNLEEHGGELVALVEYSTDLFDPTTIDRLFGHFERLLAAAVAEPERTARELPLLSTAERHQLETEWNDTAAPGAPGVVELFEEQACRSPEAVAVVFAGEEERSLTYGELDRRAELLAGHLRSLGVGPEVPVGLCAEQTPELVVGMLGIFKSGGALLAMDPAHPPARLAFLLADAAVPVLVLEPHLLAGLPPHEARTVLLTPSLPLPQEPEGSPAEPFRGAGERSRLAYLIYTSGTTGQPKAVQVEHGMLAATLAATRGQFHFTAGDRMPCLALPTFDISLFELLSTLLAGGTAVLFPLRPTLDVERLVDRLGEMTCLHAVPALMREILESLQRRGAAAPDVTGMRAVFVGGDAVPADLLEDLRRSFPAARVWVLYGPTEGTIVCAAHPVPPPPEPARPLLGRPFGGAVLHVCAADGELLPPGVPGELWIGGAGVTRGYLGRDELTAEKYVRRGGLRFYRSGDRVRRLADGNLEFLGRLDNQVKVRGFRIELSEIEAALSALPGVREAVVVVRRDRSDGGPGDPRLVAYVTGEVSLLVAEELRRSLQERLPDYMVPAAFVTLAALPLTPNGKVDRKALPAPEQPRISETYLAPRTPVEEVLAGIWAGLLGLERVGASDDFFALGGHSLLATRVTSRLRGAFGVDVPIRSLFESPVLADFARRVEAAQGAVRPGGAPPPLVPVSREQPIPLSFGQQRLWFLDQLVPENPSFNVNRAVRLVGALSSRWLEEGFAAIVRRHEALRTTFPVAADGTPHQRVAEAGPFTLPLVDLAALPGERRQPEALRLARLEARRPFDLARGPLLRLVLFRLADTEHVLTATLHHIVADGWSVGVLLGELGSFLRAALTGHPVSLPELRIQYPDFAVWQRRWLSGEVLEAELSYWRHKLAGAPPSLDLPTDRPRPPVQTTRGAALSFEMPPGLAGKLAALGRDHGATLFMTLLAGFKALLASRTGQSDVSVGTSIANRTRPEVEGLIGLFINALVLRTDLSGDPTFVELLRRVRETSLEAYAHQDLPFEKLVEALRPERDLSRTPLVQVAFTLNDARAHVLELPGLSVVPLPLDTGTAKLDLTLAAWEAEGRLWGQAEYNADLFDEASIRHLLTHFRELLEGAMADPQKRLSQLAAGLSEVPSPLVEARETLARSSNLTQRQLLTWMGHQLSPELPVFNNALCFTIETAIDPAAFSAAFRAVAAASDALRTVFEEVDGVSCQRVLAEPPAAVELLDFSAGTDPRGRLEAWARERCRVPFDLTRCLYDSVLVKLSGQSFVWYLSLHHIIADGWSVSLVYRRVAEAYESALRDGSPPPLALPAFADYVAAERSYRESPRYREVEEHWRQKLSRRREPVTFYGGPARMLSTRVERVTRRLAPEQADRLRALAARASVFRLSEDATLFQIFCAITAWYLHQISGSREMALGSIFHNRRTRTHRETIGYFSQILPLFLSFDERDSALSLVSQAADEIYEALRHREFALDNPLHNPVFEVLVNYHRASVPEFHGAPAQVAWLSPGHGLEALAIQVYDFEATGGLKIDFDFHTDVFDEARRSRAVHHFLNVLAAFLEDASVPLWTVTALSPEERDQILSAFNATRRAVPSDRVFPHLFAEQALASPEAIAVEAGGERLTYRELYQRVERLARELAALGVGPEVRVALLARRGLDLLTAILAVLEAGGAYVPLDPFDASRRRLQILLESGSALVLASAEFAADLARGLASAPPPVPQLVALEGTGAGSTAAFLPETAGPESLAYVIYTSGSTGLPKGAMLVHSGMVNHLFAKVIDLGLCAADRIAQTASQCFDISIWQFLSPFLVGARTVLLDDETTRDAAELLIEVERREISILELVPSMLRAVIEELEAGGPRAPLARLRWLLVTGEALAPDLSRRWLALYPDVPMLNAYGPTECSDDVTHGVIPHPLGDEGPAPIGKPVLNTRIYVLSPWLEVVPVGVAGELWVGGDGVGRGYLGDPARTAEAFRPDLFGGRPGARLYRTGDLARWRPNGELEYLGRRDHQVKVRGFRIETGEIEAALRAIDGVRDAVVVAREARPERGPGDQRLVAYVVGDVAADALRRSLHERLPDPMVPAAFVMLAALPLTANGKVDRKALPAPEPRISEQAYLEPRTPAEKTIAVIWCEVLGVPRVGFEDNFFDLGGHSLLLPKVQARLQARMGRKVSLVELLTHTTVRALARHLEPGETAPGLEERASTTRTPGSGAIAIVGLAGRFPGAANVEQLWANLCAGVCSIARFSDEELAAAGVDPALRHDPRYVPAGGALEGVELFDAGFFGYTPREAEILNPQHRLFLECAWEALEDAGYDSQRVPGPVGTFAGIGFNTYLHQAFAGLDRKTATAPQLLLGNDKDFLTTRVSYKLDLKGPSMAVQTACSSSLVAVHLACQNLLLGACDMALAGGVSITLPQGVGYLYEEGGINSPDGRCRAFDAESRGTVRGSGVGIVVLKRLEDALAQGDTVRAVILGSAVNNDGSEKAGYMAPGVSGQAEVVTRALAAAGVDPATVSYVEAHGTGTILGDPIEVQALARAFQRGGPREGSCALGSVKSNLGHLDTAAGVTGLIKATLALQHGLLPPSLGFSRPNPHIDFAAGPFHVQTELAPWERGFSPRRAGVSSLGIGGTNAHAVLEEAPPAEPSGASRPLQLLLLSARTPGALEEATARLAAWLEGHPEAPLADVAYTLRVGRRPFEHWRMLVCASREDALAALRSRDPERLLERQRESDPPPLAWLLPGQGSQHPGMGRDLYETEPLFRREIDACAGILAPRLGRDLREILFSTAGAELTETHFAQPALFAVEHALARLWLSWGLRPQALLGHSLGEYVAACLAGVLSLEEALALVAARGELMQELPPGAMLSVDLSEGEILAEIAVAPGLSLAAVNGPGQCVVSGPAADVAALGERLARREVPCRRLHTSHAFHSGMMEPILDRFAAIVSRVALRPPAIPYLSNLTGTWITAAEATDPGYWTRHLREPVRFGDGVSRLLAELPPGAVLLETGPGRALGQLVRGRAAGRTVLASMPHPNSPESGAAALLQAVGRLWLAGVEIDWQAFQGEEKRRRIPLPTYPFERQRFWVEAPRSGFAAGAAPVDPRRFVVLGGGEPVRANRDLGGLLRDPRNAEVLERLLDAEPGLRVLLPLPPEPETSPEPGAPAAPSRPSGAGHRRPELSTPYREPQTEIERRLATIWEDLLGIAPVGIHDDFFELGGHSLLATRLLSRIREDFGCEIPLETLFVAPTVARLSAHLATGEEEPAPQASPILPAPREGDLPLSFAQQRLLFLAVMAPGDPSYNLPLGLRLAGPLEVSSLQLALDALVARHEPLRTTFRIEESQVTQVIEPAARLPLPLADLAGLPADLREAEVRRLALEQARHPFDLLRGPVVTFVLVRLAPAEHLLQLTVHHIAADGWSCAVLYRDLTELYRAIVEGRQPRLPELAVQYADFAAWQRSRLQEEALERHLEYWRTHLAGARAPVLPTDRPRPLRPSGRGAMLHVTLPAETVGAARRLARDEDATLFMVLLSAFAVLLHRASGCDDLLIGTDIANRNRRETEDLIGLFVNQLVLRNDLSGNPTFREVLRRVRRTTLNAYAHQDAPFDRLVEALNPVRDLGTTPLFQVKLVLQNARMPLPELTDFKVSALGVHNQTAKFDLLLNLAETGDAMSGVLEYSLDLWGEASMRRLLDDFATALAAGTARPDEHLSQIEEGLSRPSQPPGEERRTILRRRAIPVSTE